MSGISHQCKDATSTRLSEFNQFSVEFWLNIKAHTILLQIYFYFSGFEVQVDVGDLRRAGFYLLYKPRA